MRFTLQIDMNDDVFAEEPSIELTRILRSVVERIELGALHTAKYSGTQTLFDVNGNACGMFGVVDSPPGVELPVERYISIGATREVQARRNALFAAYEQALRALHAGGFCTWPLSRLNEVCIRGFEQIEKGLADTKSATVRATCNALGIACTRAAIKRYLAGGGA